MGGPLDGVRIVELAGMGALPFATLKLGDMGAEVIRVDRLSEVPAKPEPRPHNFWDRGRRSIGVDLKNPHGVEVVCRLVEGAEVFLESFRPGVCERLGLGPDVLQKRNAALVYGRLTGWGQEGPLAQSAGHSLNYESLTGVVRAIGPRGGPPVPPLTVVGDFAGGGLSLAYGVVCALLEARSSGKGQVVDAAMIDGVMSLAAPFYAMHESGMHTDSMGSNLFDGGAPFYNVYETSDGKYVSVAPIEGHFYALLLAKLGLDANELPDRDDPTQWAALREQFAALFLTQTRDYWCELLEGTDACFAPVLSFTEARDHPHHVARGTFVAGAAMPEMIPTPRMDRTPGKPGPSPAWTGADTDPVLQDGGFSADEIADLRKEGAIA
jgi:alpha-methylacyl-CoA racemase